MITCRVLGPVELSVGDAPAPAELLWRKHLALLVYLAHAPQRTRSREQLVGLLWGEKPEAAARHSLSEALRIIRRYAGEDAITTQGGQIGLADDVVELDTVRFEAHVRDGRWPDAAALVAGEFMEGFAVGDAWEFEEWLAGQRREWRRRSAEALVRAAELSLDAGTLDRAQAFGSRALQFEPASDAACRAMMRTLALGGNRAAALGHFVAFERHLDEELGLEPEDETRALAHRIRQERSWQPTSAAPVAVSDTRRPPLIGRHEQLNVLLTHWTRCRTAREPTLLIVDGEPGAGKSRLAEEVASRARLDGAETLIARAIAADSGQAWSTTRALLGERQEVGDGNAVVALLRALAGDRSLLLVVDDAQHADDESLGAITRALRDLQDVSLLLMLLCGPQPSSPVIDELRSRVGRDVNGAVLRIGPLSAAALRELCRWAMPTYDELQVERLARRVALDSAGLPLFAVELLHAVAAGLNLRESPAAAWPEPARTVDHTLPGTLPEPLVAAIRVGFRKTSARAQQVLIAAAVLNERVPMQALAAATGLEEDDLVAALDELEWGRWLAGEPRGFTFVARLVREVVARDMVTSAQRERLLSRVRGDSRSAGGSRARSGTAAGE